MEARGVECVAMWGAGQTPQPQPSHWRTSHGNTVMTPVWNLKMMIRQKYVKKMRWSVIQCKIKVNQNYEKQREYSINTDGYATMNFPKMKIQ